MTNKHAGYPVERACSPSEPVKMKFTAAEWGAFERYCQAFEHDDHDVPDEMMRHLVEIGLILPNHLITGYRITGFAKALLNTTPEPTGGKGQVITISVEAES